MRIALGFAALLYGVIALGANAAAGGLGADDWATLDSLRRGEMAKLVLHDEPRPEIAEPFEDADGNALTFADFAGKVVLVNLWATWCAPCRAEMPSLDRLAGEMAGGELAVIALSSDRGGAERIRRFYDEVGVRNLGIHRDGRSRIARAAGALGLPVTLVLDRQGREIARLTGDAEWDAPEVRAFLTRLIELTAPEA